MVMKAVKIKTNIKVLTYFIKRGEYENFVG